MVDNDIEEKEKYITCEPDIEEIDIADDTFSSLFGNAIELDESSFFNFGFDDEKDEISESENLFKEAKDAYNKVDDKLLIFIGNFVKNQNEVAIQKRTLKNVFFWFTMIGFATIVLTPIMCFAVLAFVNVSDYYIIFGAIVASLLEVLATVIVLPKIVAEYLFNKEEENANIKIVELMQKYSDTIHGYDN